MKFRTILTLVFLTYISLSFCQKNYFPGYVLKSEKDTLFGWIKKTSDNENYNQCVFRSSKKDADQIYYPQQILGYRFYEGGYYLSKSLSNSSSTKMVFTEFIVQSNINLYIYLDEDMKKHHYFSKNDSTLDEISIVQNRVMVQGVYYNFSKQINNEIIKDYIQSCPQLIPDVDKMNYCNTAKLIKLLSDYQQCNCVNQNTFVCYQKKEKKEFHPEVELLGGINSSHLYEEELQYLSNEFNTSMVYWGKNLGLSAYFPLKINGTKGQVYFKTGVVIGSYHVVFNEIYGLTFDRRYTTYHFPVQFQYHFSKNKLSPLISYGISLSNNKLDYTPNTGIKLNKLSYTANVGIKYAILEKLSIVSTFDIHSEFLLIFPIKNLSIISSGVNLGVRYTL